MCHELVGQDRTNVSNSRWNRVDISFCSKAISTSGLVPDILSSGCRSKSGNVGSDIFNSDMVANVGVAVGIALPSVSVQKLFPLTVS